MASDLNTPESSAPSSRGVLLTAGVVVACFLIFAGIVWLAYGQKRSTDLTADLSKVDAADQWKFTAEGRASRLQELRAKADAAATTYGWIDQKAGVVRLPIDRAMELVVAEQGRPRP